MRSTSEYINEAIRETAMRRQVYPGRISIKKMTQSQADREILLMQQIGIIFQIAQLREMNPSDLRLPLYEPGGSPYPITTLEPHIKACENELRWRELIYDRRVFGKSTAATKKEQIETMREMLEHLRAIQSQSNQGAAPDPQQKLF